MSELKKILQSKIKPKEKVSLLAGKIKENRVFIDEIINYYDDVPSGEQGHLIESLEYISQDNPEFVVPYSDFIIKHLEDEAPRVKWECARVVGNLAEKFPESSEKAINGLLKNANNKGTVVRWSVAFALSEIVKSSKKMAKKLLPIIKELSEKETNSGVKNVYLKVLKTN